MNDCACNKFCNNDGQFVDITGKCNPADFTDLNTNPNWTQISVPTVFNIPREKPDMEELNSENVTVQIIKKKVIVTPAGEKTGSPALPAYVENLEGKIETGRKLVVEGLICKAISYTALNEEQSIHSAHVSVPFSAYIVLPAVTATKDPLNINYEVKVCVEDVFIKEVCKRQIFENITLFLQAVEAPGKGCNEEECEGMDNVQIKGIATREELEAITLKDTLPDNMWTQLVISETLEIPQKKPDIEQINSLFSHIDIISQRVVKTPAPTGENFEGTKLTGKKLIIEGVLRQKISYTADVESGSQPLHSAHFDIPFSAFIVIDNSYSSVNVFRIQPFIEDIFICAVDERHVFKNSIIFIKATPCS